MYSEEEFVRLIDIPHAAEIIAERFDNALELMGKNGIVYGGAIRDLAAGMPIAGDLDIAVSHYGYPTVLGEFTTSSKWTKVAVNGCRPKAEPRPFAETSKKKRTASITLDSRPYGLKSDYHKITPISTVVTFETFDRARVQIVRVKTAPGNMTDPLGTLFELARGADMRCCSLAMNTLGKIFELVDGAYADCIKRVLRINDVEDESRFANLEERIKKLITRGWTSEVDITKAKAKIRRMELERLKREKEFFEKMKLSSKKCRDDEIDEYVAIVPGHSGGIEFIVYRSLSPKINMNVDSAVDMFRKMHLLDIKEINRTAKTIKYSVRNMRIADHVKEYLKNKLKDVRMRTIENKYNRGVENNYSGAGWKKRSIEPPVKKHYACIEARHWPPEEAIEPPEEAVEAEETVEVVTENPCAEIERFTPERSSDRLRHPTSDVAEHVHRPKSTARGDAMADVPIYTPYKPVKTKVKDSEISAFEIGKKASKPIKTREAKGYFAGSFIDPREKKHKKSTRKIKKKRR